MLISRLRSINPANGDVVWEGPEANDRQVADAVARARNAAPLWAATPLADRVAIVRAFREQLEASADALATTICQETGKPWWEGKAEIASMIAKAETSIIAQAERAGENHVTMGFGEAVLRHRPHGVMAVLGPYNFPGHLPNGHIIPALLAGNSIVFKPSELAPAIGEAMADAWRAAGLPEGVFGLVQGGRSTGAALVAQDIDGLLFTGSARAGAHFRRIFADRPKVILALELGGNNPLVVWDADNIEEAASVVAQSAFITTGQRCSCARRLIVPDNDFGTALVEALTALSDRLTIDAWNGTPEPFMGPLISDAAARDARAAVAALEVAGAKVVRGGNGIPGRRDAFMRPAILDVTDAAVPDEEIFAPVLQLRRVGHFDDALRQANATSFGLSAGLVSGDDALWARFVHVVRAGVINRNRPTTGAAGVMPFGGLGDSGNHRPGAWYAADYCAFPVASFEASSVAGNSGTIARMLRV